MAGRRGIWTRTVGLAAVALAVLLLGLPREGEAQGRRRTAIPGPVEAEVLKVVDGDTLRVRATIWVNQFLEILVRVDGTDAPELRARCDEERLLAVLARAELERIVSVGTVVLWNIRNEKYGNRVVARVSTPDGKDVGEAMRRSGLSRTYDGGPRASWCG